MLRLKRRVELDQLHWLCCYTDSESELFAYTDQKYIYVFYDDQFRKIKKQPDEYFYYLIANKRFIVGIAISPTFCIFVYDLKDNKWRAHRDPNKLVSDNIHAVFMSTHELLITLSQNHGEVVYYFNIKTNVLSPIFLLKTEDEIISIHYNADDNILFLITFLEHEPEKLSYIHINPKYKEVEKWGTIGSFSAEFIDGCVYLPQSKKLYIGQTTRIVVYDWRRKKIVRRLTNHYLDGSVWCLQRYNNRYVFCRDYKAIYLLDALTERIHPLVFCSKYIAHAYIKGRYVYVVSDLEHEILVYEMIFV